jgi:hypothetical protein
MDSLTNNNNKESFSDSGDSDYLEKDSECDNGFGSISTDNLFKKLSDAGAKLFDTSSDISDNSARKGADHVERTSRDGNADENFLSFPSDRANVTIRSKSSHVGGDTNDMDFERSSNFDNVQDINTSISRLIEEIKTLNATNIDLRNETKTLNLTLDAVKSQILLLQKKVLDQASEIKTLNNTVQHLEEKNNDLERNLNRNRFIIKGAVVSNSAKNNGVESVPAAIAETLGLNAARFTDNCIVSKMGQNSEKFQIQISNHRLIKDIFGKMKSVKPLNLFFSDFLTKHDDNIAFQLRNLKRKKKLSVVSSSRGVVFCQVSPNSTRTYIKNKEDFDALLTRIQN